MGSTSLGSKRISALVFLKRKKKKKEKWTDENAEDPKDLGKGQQSIILRKAGNFCFVCNSGFKNLQHKCHVNDQLNNL